MKKAIVAVSYGTLNAEACEKSICAFEKALKKAFPEYELKRAFTGKRIREMIKSRGGEAQSVEETLEELANDGYDEIAVQPSHIIDGSECELIYGAVKKYEDKFSKICVGKPLLSSAEDMEAVCRVLANEFCADNGELVVMGHGSDHRSNCVYAELADVCRRLGYGHIHIATLESTPSLEDLFPALALSLSGKIFLTPLLFAAGDHACRDMAGDEPHSWKSRLTAAGYSVVPVVKGLGEYAEIRGLYTVHLKNALQNT